MEKSETKFIIVNYRRDQAVQNWSFADKKHIIYCNSAEWAMKFADKAGAKRTLDYLRKNFPEILGQDSLFLGEGRVIFQLQVVHQFTTCSFGSSSYT